MLRVNHNKVVFDRVECEIAKEEAMKLKMELKIDLSSELIGL